MTRVFYFEGGRLRIAFAIRASSMLSLIQLEQEHWTARLLNGKLLFFRRRPSQIP